MAQPKSQCESVFKVLLIGDTEVGKTSMVARYCYNQWLPRLKTTVGADYAVKSVKWSTTETVKLHLWDIVGQERFRSMTRPYFRGASGCVVMFDVTNEETLEHTREWKADLDSKVVLPSGEPIPSVLVANKDDLPNKAVTPEEVAKFAEDAGFTDWRFVSVKANRNVTEAMSQLIHMMLQLKYNTGTVQLAEDKRRDSIKVSGTCTDCGTHVEQKKSRNCCRH